MSRLLPRSCPDHPANALLALLALIVAGTAVLMAGCGHVQVQIETSPTPDSRLGTIAYVRGGDIWTRVLPYGNPSRLTSDGINREPLWSPSGRWLAFFKGQTDLWLMHGDGSRAMRVGAATFARWAPSTDELAFISGTSASRTGLSLTDPESGTTAQIVSYGNGPAGTGVLSFAWSQDSHNIAYSTEERVGDPSAMPPTRHTALYITSVPEVKPIELLNGGEPATQGYIVACWAGDGSRVFFWRDPGFSASLLADGAPLASASVNGGDAQDVDPAVLVYEDEVASAATLPDIAFVSGSGRATWTNKSLTIYSLATSDKRTLTSGVAVSSPRWSPDAGAIVYVAMPDAGEVADSRIHDALMGRHLFLTSPETGRTSQITNDDLYRDASPRWIGKDSVLFARISKDNRASLWVLPSMNGHPTEVAEELTPLPGPQPSWLGYFGHIDWTQMFDWTPSRQ